MERPSRSSFHKLRPVLHPALAVLAGLRVERIGSMTLRHAARIFSAVASTQARREGGMVA
jgi:hypothetical protein